MEPIYILKRDKIITGPFTFEKLKSIGIKTTDKLWFKGLSDWTVAGDIQAFNEIPRIVPSRPDNLLKKIFSFLS
ncbi:MAG: DUF4339 domain-containing protein [Sphingobacteriia bacterium]|nr:DUF4339 domain-containing protein [Sphingobacteriia bacterium]